MTRVNRTQKVFSIDSNQKLGSSESGSKFSVKLDVPQRNAFNKASCLSCELPKSFYLIDSSNDSFTLNEATGGGDTTGNLPVGFYDVNTFIAALKTELDATSSNGQTYTVTYSTTTGKITIVNGTNDFTLTLNESYQKYLGMASSVTSSSSSLTGSSTINLQHYDVLYVKCNQISNSNDNVLVELYPSSVADQGIIKYTAPDGYLNSVSLTDNTSEIFQFTVEDKDNNVIQLNGGHTRITMSCWNENL